MFEPWDSEEKIPFPSGVWELCEMMCHVAVVLSFLKTLITGEDVFRAPQNSRWKKKKWMPPGGIPLCSGFEFSSLLCSYLYKCQACCWYVWELLDTILKEEALFFLLPVCLTGVIVLMLAVHWKCVYFNLMLKVWFEKARNVWEGLSTFFLRNLSMDD